MHNYLPGFIKQFDPEEGELNVEEWTAVQFLRWLELNDFHIIKDLSLHTKVSDAIDIIRNLPVSRISKEGGIAALKLVLGELENAFYCEGVDKLNFAQKCHQQCDDCKTEIILPKHKKN